MGLDAMDRLQVLKQNIIDAGRWLWEKDLVTAFNGNISVRADERSILVTCRGTCLGRLVPGDITRISIEGLPLDGGSLPARLLCT